MPQCLVLEETASLSGDTGCALGGSANRNVQQPGTSTRSPRAEKNIVHLKGTWSGRLTAGLTTISACKAMNLKSCLCCMRLCSGLHRYHTVL